MKNIKKLLALVLALAICAAFALPAVAAEGDIEISVDTTKAAGHTYDVYQIFTGTVDSTKEVLSDVKVGSAFTEGYKSSDSATPVSIGGNVPSTDLDAFTEMSGEQFAKDLFAGNYGKLGATIGTLAADNNYKLSVAPGYYLIVDKGNSDATVNDNDSPLILQVIGDTEIDPKVDQTTLEKKVEAAENVYQDYVDKNVGQEFHFQLTASVTASEVPANGKGSYDLDFHDVMSSGLDYKEDLKIVIKSANGESDTITLTEDQYEYTPLEGTENREFNVKFDLVSVLGETDRSTITDEHGKITVVLTYLAALNENAIIYPGTDEDGNVNINDADLKYGANGQTKHDQAYVYSFRIDSVKIDGEQKGDGTYDTLEGVEFNLYRADADGNNTGDPLLFTQKANGEYVLAKADTPNASATIKSGSDGQFNIVGLQSGKYNLVETKALDGYNMIEDPIHVDITINSENDKPIDNVTLPKTEAGEKKTEIADVLEIINNKGSLLPSTGGIGTTIFYVVGAVLVVGAGVLLFTKRRIKG